MCALKEAFLFRWTVLPYVLLPIVCDVYTFVCSYLNCYVPKVPKFNEIHAKVDLNASKLLRVIV